MSRRSRRRKSDSELVSVIGIVCFLAVLSFYSSLTPFQQRLALISGLIVVAGAVALLMLLQLRMLRHNRQKLQALTIADIDSMDGLLFEKYVAELLRTQGYHDIKLTERYDMGVDIIALKDSVRWGIQVKRYRNIVKAAAVRQVVTALTTYNCQRAMVVTNSIYSRPAKLLADANQCVLVDKDILAEWILAFQYAQQTNSKI